MRTFAKVAGAATLVLSLFFLHPGAPAEAGINPMTTLVRGAEDTQPLHGTVRERLRAGGYTYLALDTAQGPRWAVTMGRGQEPGTKVRVRSFGHSARFHSKRLHRTFPDLVFGIVSRLD